MGEDVTDRVVAIAGATGTVGRAAAREFARRGTRLALFGSNAERLAGIAEDLGLVADRTVLHAADLRDGEAADRAIAAVLAAFGRIDVLVQVVGGWTGGSPIASTSPDDLRAMLDQHVWTTFNLVHAIVPSMTAARWGRIVAVSSPAAVDAPARSVAYAAAKAAQEAILRSAAHELEGTGVTANVLVVRSIGEDERGQDAQRGKRAMTTPEEIVEAMLYLCSDAAASINGARLPLYGG